MTPEALKEINDHIRALEQEKAAIQKEAADAQRAEAASWALQFLNKCYRTPFSANFYEGSIYFHKITGYRLDPQPDSPHIYVTFEGETIQVGLSYYNIRKNLFNGRGYRGSIFATFEKSKEGFKRSKYNASVPISKIQEYPFMTGRIRDPLVPTPENKKYFESHYIQLPDEKYEEIKRFVNYNSQSIYQFFEDFMQQELSSRSNGEGDILTPANSKKLQTNAIKLPHVNFADTILCHFDDEVLRFTTRLGQYIVTTESTEAMHDFTRRKIVEESRWRSGSNSRESLFRKMYEMVEEEYKKSIGKK